MSRVIETLIDRVKLVKDFDPYNKKLLNDCYTGLISLQDEVSSLRAQLGIRDDANEDNNTEGNRYEGY